MTDRTTDILVVDDSPVDRQLIGGLVSKLKDTTVRFAADGEQALKLLAEQSPTLVLVDLIMPGINGLELVERIRESYAHIPTILLTSQGNEDVAVRALQKGAASYVPKSKAATELGHTIRGVMRQSRIAHTQHRLMNCCVESTCRFELENDLTLIAPLVSHLQEMLARLRLCDETERMRVGVALDEAIVNAVYHGNLELSPELREAGGDAYRRAAEERAHEEPYSRRKLLISAQVSPDRAQFRIQDEGPGFDPASLPDPTDPANLESVGGRGILLMRTFMDEVSFDVSGNCVTMVKNRQCQCPEF
jgi:CheY-like chemotaxis protein